MRPPRQSKRAAPTHAPALAVPSYHRILVKHGLIEKTLPIPEAYEMFLKVGADEEVQKLRRKVERGSKMKHVPALYLATAMALQGMTKPELEALKLRMEAKAAVPAKAEPESRAVAPAPSPGSTSGIAAAEALSFLKQTKGEVSWTAREMAATLKLSAKQAAQALAVLQMQGYVKPASGASSAAEGSEWMTTPEGEAVAGAKAPRFTRASVEKALAELKERLAALNHDAKSEFRVRAAVAFGDFLSERAQVQAADVGVELARRDAEGHDANSVVEQTLRREVLRKLRGRSALVNLRPYDVWMAHRSHRKLV